MVSWEVAQKCLLFAEGKRGHTLFNGVKCADFPESLLQTDSKCGNTGEKIGVLFSEGKSTYEIAEAVGLTQQAVALQTKRIKEKRQFYEEWNGFIETLAEIKAADFPIADIFTAEADRGSVGKATKKGIRTVGDFLLFTVSHDKRTCILAIGKNPEQYSRLFGQLTEFLRNIFKKRTAKKNIKSDFPGQISLFDLM